MPNETVVSQGLGVGHVGPQSGSLQAAVGRVFREEGLPGFRLIFASCRALLPVQEQCRHVHQISVCPEVLTLIDLYRCG